MPPPLPSSRPRSAAGPGGGGRLMSPSVLQRLPCRRLPPPRHSAYARRPLLAAPTRCRHRLSRRRERGRKVSDPGSRLPSPQLCPECVREHARGPARRKLGDSRIRSAERLFSPRSGREGDSLVPSPDPMSPPPRPPTSCETALTALTGSLCFVIQSRRAGASRGVLHTVGAK